MLDYTRAAVTLILEDFKKFAKAFKNASLVFTTAYFIYVLIARTGLFAANVVLASLFFIYTIFEFITFKKDPNVVKNVKQMVRKSYKWISLGIKLITLVALVYGIYNATTAMTPFSTITTTLMIVLWIFQVFLELLIQIVESKVVMVREGITKDVEELRKPLDGFKNIVKRVKREPLPPVPEKSKEMLRLEKRIEAIETEKKNKKKAKSKFLKTKKAKVEELPAPKAKK